MALRVTDNKGNHRIFMDADTVSFHQEEISGRRLGWLLYLENKWPRPLRCKYTGDIGNVAVIPEHDFGWKEAKQWMKDGYKIKLPEWTGFWKMNNGRVFDDSGMEVPEHKVWIYTDRKDFLLA